MWQDSCIKKLSIHVTRSIVTRRSKCVARQLHEEVGMWGFSCGGQKKCRCDWCNPHRWACHAVISALEEGRCRT